MRAKIRMALSVTVGGWRRYAQQSRLKPASIICMIFWSAPYLAYDENEVMILSMQFPGDGMAWLYCGPPAQDDGQKRRDGQP